MLGRTDMSECRESIVTITSLNFSDEINLIKVLARILWQKTICRDQPSMLFFFCYCRPQNHFLDWLPSRIDVMQDNRKLNSSGALDYWQFQTRNGNLRTSHLRMHATEPGLSIAAMTYPGSVSCWAPLAATGPLPVLKDWSRSMSMRIAIVATHLRNDNFDA